MVIEDELSLYGFLFCIMVVPSVHATVCQASVATEAVEGPMGDGRVSGSLGNDSLRCELIVTDWTLATYSAAMSLATGAMQAFTCCL